MAIRRGINEIEKRNREVAAMMGQSNIPELRLFGDGDMAFVRVLSEDPLDVDFHEVFDAALGNKRRFYYCKESDEGGCEYHKDLPSYPIVRMFMFWMWVYKIWHVSPADDGSWKPVEHGQRTYYEEPVSEARMLRSKLGRGAERWEQFRSVYDTYGTWKDRDYIYRRKGPFADPNVVYNLTPLDKSPLPDEIVKIMGKLPPLEAVAKGKITRNELIAQLSGQAAATSPQPSGVPVQETQAQTQIQAQAQAQTQEPRSEASEPDSEPRHKIDLPEDSIEFGEVDETPAEE